MQLIGWKRHKDLLLEGLAYVKGRKEGKIKSIKLFSKQFNRLGLNGFEWCSMVTIAARPGVGKTLIADCITRDIQALNPNDDISILNFQFDMTGRNVALRDLASATNQNLRYIQSAEDDGMEDLSDEDYKKMYDYVQNQEEKDEYTIDESLTAAQIEYQIAAFHKEKYDALKIIRDKELKLRTEKAKEKEEKGEKLTKSEKKLIEKISEGEQKKRRRAYDEQTWRKVKLIAKFDHTLLIDRGDDERSQKDTLEAFAKMCVRLKKKYDILIICLSQLLRTLDSADRQNPGQASNYPIDGDIYGSDFLFQCSDIVMAFNRPAKYNMSKYGPFHYHIRPIDKFLLACHVLKNRYDAPCVKWFKADYPTMSLADANTPERMSKNK